MLANSRRIDAWILSILGLAGLWLRLRHLGELPLIVDEGIQALAVRGILEHGIPQFDSGFVYVRSLPLLYLQAAMVELFGLTPFALRLPSAVFGAAIVLPSYLLGRALFGRHVGLLTAALLAFSCWEIEFARYARSYPLFQVFFLLSLLCFYRGFMLDQRRFRWIFLFVAFVTITTHELSALLLPCFVLPYLVDSVPRRLKLSIPLWAGAFVLARAIHERLQSWIESMGPPYTVGSVAQLEVASDAPDLIARLRLILRLPKLNLPDLEFALGALREQPIFAFAIVAIVAGAAILLVWRARSTRVPSVLLAAFALLLAAARQFALASLVLLAHLVLYGRSWGDLMRGPFAVAASATAALLVVWVAAVAMPFGGWKWSALSAFAYPDLWHYMLRWLVLGWPVLTIVTAIAAAALLGQFRRDRSDPAPIFALGAILAPALVAAAFSSYKEARYFLHLYPLIVIPLSWGLLRAAEPLVARFSAGQPSRRFAGYLVLGVVALFLSQDANPLKAWRIGERTFGSQKDPVRSIISWQPYAGFHQDHEMPGRYVAAHRAAADIVIAVGPVHAIGLFHLYAGGVDWVLNPSADFGYTIVIDGQTRYFLTGSGVVSSPDELRALIERAPAGVWLLSDSPLLSEETSFYPQDTKLYLRELTSDPVVIGRDGRTWAVRVK